MRSRNLKNIVLKEKNNRNVSNEKEKRVARISWTPDDSNIFASVYIGVAATGYTKYKYPFCFLWDQIHYSY